MQMLALILDAVTAALKFPDALSRLLKLLRDTPEEQHEKLLQSIEAEAANIQKTGRPTWG